MSDFKWDTVTPLYMEPESEQTIQLRARLAQAERDNESYQRTIDHNVELIRTAQMLQAEAQAGYQALRDSHETLRAELAQAEKRADRIAELSTIEASALRAELEAKLAKAEKRADAMVEENERLKQVASMNPERIDILTAKHGGKVYDAARLAVLQEAVAVAFHRQDVEVGLLKVELEATKRERDAAAARLAEMIRIDDEAHPSITLWTYDEVVAERDRYRQALEDIANDGNGRGMGGGLRRDGDDLRDIARAALEKKP